MNNKFVYGFLRLVDNVVSVIVLCAIALLFAYGSYAIWDVVDVSQEASSVQYETYKPTKDKLSFAELQAINPDVFGWVTVYGTNVDYPLLQANDNDKYLKTSSQGKYSMSGSVFLDYRNNKAFTDFNHVIYGHHMAHHAMFGDIGEFADEAFFESHPYGEIYFGDKTYGLEFFAFNVADVYNTGLFEAAVVGQQQQEAYLSEILDNALYKRDINVTTQDRIVLLTTCSENPTNGRHLLIGKLTDTVFENTFADENGNEKKKPVAAIDSVLMENSDIAQILMLGLIIILLALVVMLITKTRKNNGRTR